MSDATPCPENQAYDQPFPVYDEIEDEVLIFDPNKYEFLGEASDVSLDDGCEPYLVNRQVFFRFDKVAIEISDSYYAQFGPTSEPRIRQVTLTNAIETLVRSGQKVTGEHVSEISHLFYDPSKVVQPAEVPAPLPNESELMYSVGEMCEITGVKNDTLRKYGKPAVARWPSRGQHGKQFKICDALKIVHAVLINSEEKAVKKQCEDWLHEHNQNPK